MICLGNICRSPTAQGVLEKLIENKGLSDVIEVDSAATSNYHCGQHPDPRSIAAAARRGYSLQEQVARQVIAADFQQFDYLLAMDRDNLRHLQQATPPQCRAQVQLLLDYSPHSPESVPDPYFGGEEQGFEVVLDLLEIACANLLLHLQGQFQGGQV